MTVREKLDLWRKDLLDMSRRNSLLYLSSTGRSSSVQLNVEADDLFRRLVHGVKPCVLTPEATLLEPDDFPRRLDRLRAKAREALNDRGMQVLYVAFGLLEWKETPNSDEVIRSPLVLVPVELRKEGYFGGFQLARLGDEEITVNPTLTAKLTHDFALALPAYEAIEAAVAAGTAGSGTNKFTLTDVCQRIQGALPPDSPWVLVREAHLGAFSFQKLVMYQDLTKHSAEVRAHPILRALGGEAAALPHGGGSVTADEMDERVRPADMLEILDADSSQQEAIQAAKAGRSFVLQGPPGTGKSQTIANIIAECLGQNRRVLFVSEKMAALDVVRQRLRDAGLGEFLLDLHNARTDKKAFIADLKQQVEAVTDLKAPTEDVSRWDRDSFALAGAREQLNEYVRELHAPRAPLGRSAFMAHGVLARYAAAPDIDAAIPGVERMTAVEVDERRRALEALLTRVDVLDEYATYPWRETLAQTHSLELEGGIRAHFGQLERGLAGLDEVLIRLRKSLGEEGAALTFGWAELALRRAGHANHTPLPPVYWMLPETPPRLREVLAFATAQTDRHRDALARFEPFYLPSARTLDTSVLLPVLTEDASWAMACLRVTQPTPQDAAIGRRDDLDMRLNAAQSLLPGISSTASALAELCGLPTPETVEASAALAELAGCLLDTPQPPASWLDPDTFAGVRALALDTSARHAEAHQTRSTLETMYSPTLFMLDVPALTSRFSTQYANVLRFLKPSYYADVNQVRTTLKVGQVRDVAALRSDLIATHKVLYEEHRLREASMEHARVFGRFFSGEATDWAALRAAVDWTTRFHTFVARGEVTSEVLRLATGPVSARAALRDAKDALAKRLGEWRDIGAALGALLKPEMLAEETHSLEAAKMDTLLAGLERLHSALHTYWQAVDTVASHLRRSATGADHVPSRDGEAKREAPAWAALCSCVRLAAELNALDTWLASQEGGLRHDLGERYAGWETNWTEAEEALTWAEVLLNTYPHRKVPDVLRGTLAEGGDPQARERLRAALEGTRGALASVEMELRFSDTVLPRAALLEPGKTQEQTSMDALRERVAFHLEKLPCLERWLQCASYRAECEALGLGEVVRATLRISPFPRDITDMFEKRFSMLWLDAVRRDCPALRSFSGDTHAQTIARFRELDENHQQLARRKLAARLHRMRADAVFVRRQDSDDDITRSFEAVRREVNKKRHRSIRHIVATSTSALLLLKPCWLMSPLSVSQYVESPDALFDIVIFDEASQVCPEDAICAILRGKQLIVVGDSKQLPPTRFFTKTLADTTNDADEDDEGAQAEDERTPSILEECQATGFPQSSLLWHYRSQHESLIAFSNEHFYDGKLQTFPGPQEKHEDGVRFEYVEDGRYDKGRSRQNRLEAERVVDLILEHVRAHVDLSLGVVALSEAQQRAIDDALKSRLQQRPDLRSAYEEHLDQDAAGGFFIKNLESVQGDERDVILLSVGYGKHDESGKVALNFGPVNREGGERRLNVAVTRARHRLILVTSLHASDLPSDLKNLGAWTLRDYLEYAEFGPNMLIQQRRDAESLGSDELRFDSPFEEAVYDALTAKGLSLATQVGCSGYRIDLAARDPRDAGRFLLGIECDGAMYHSSKTARDRDRLRQQHLERMGWRIHRIWSRDWVRDPAGEVTKVLRAAEEAQVVTSGRAVITIPLSDLEGAVVPGEMATPNTLASLPVRVPASAAVTRPVGSASMYESSIRSLARTCETCSFYQEQTATRFYCGRDATSKARQANGHTPSCPAWKALPSTS